ncbi:glutamine-tRNA ligase [Acanthamoeba castellanii str. Neff]|uniref:glutamine--tRNA ligase n=1 Tax=Acanthamoeba castellanii (strain ATCC 30010 / Neff) TaxID=1257118 RepID=L8HDJ2_ACACF|nr:glutamine-tRNA ligase [Acanthamoeba castellanii str. Neff]ELR22833.1 glutamine-tRNA ligase [Acanthamoeba castellanii str. Neff]
MTTEERSAALMRVYHFADSKLKETLKNPELTLKLLALAREAGVEDGCDKAVGNLLYETAGKFPAGALEHRAKLCAVIGNGELKKKEQLIEAFNYFKNLKGDFNEDAFKATAGIGLEVTDDQIVEAIRALIGEREEEIKERGTWVWMDLFKVLKDRFKFHQKEARELLEKEFGPMPKGKEPARAKPTDAAAVEEARKKEEREREERKISLNESIKLHAPRDNPFCKKRPELLEKHLRETGGRVVTRFPPEPNGYLHIGHAKAMNLNFGYAKRNGGWCYLRFDDTNPEKESQEYIDSITDSVRWLGHEPYKVTHAADYFDQLYEFAKELIRRDKAFVCHQTADEMKAGRQARRETGVPHPSPWRDRPIEESLRLFEDMRMGKFKEGEATLRMKQDLTSHNPCLWDHVAYRVKFVPHPHAGDKWCIYPSYDFTHCICDSIENITHSLCSLEFEVRRESYEWVLDALDIYRSPQIEYSRLNITYTVMSKRKLIQLVDEKYVTGWDDPRLLTVNGLRRRGYTPESINAFCERVGVTRTFNMQDYELLEECCRQDLEVRADRAMVVLNPLRVVLTNYPEDRVEDRAMPVHPDPAQNRGTVAIPLSRVVYIDRNDFRLEDSPTYYRLAPGKEVRLKYAYNIRCTQVIQDADGNVTELRAEVDLANTNKPKGNIHWVAQPAPGVEPMAMEVRIYDRLFKSRLPEGTKEEPKNFLDDINPDSLHVIRGALANPHLRSAKLYDRFQFEREGYFVVDKDSTEDHLVWNRIVTLKEDKLKDAKQ